MSDDANDKRKRMLDAMEHYYQEETLPAALAENYSIVSCLKYTAAKKVYLLQEKHTYKRYILKCRSQDEAELLQKEFEILRDFNGECLPSVVSCFTESGITYLLREYLEGETVEQRVERKGPYSPKEAIQAMISLCRCVQVLHQHEPALIHRDVKPQNVLIAEDGTCKLFDFDTVREYKQDVSRDTVYVGTQGTAAPEQFGFGQTSIRTDIYGMGILFLYLLTGNYTVDCPEWKALPLPLRTTITKCIAVDPKRRYASITALQRELWYLQHFSKRKKTIILQSASMLTGACCVAVILLLFWRHHQSAGQQIHFQNPRIEAAVRQTLDIDAYAPIYPEDLEQVTTLILCGDRVFQSWEEHQAWHDTYFQEFEQETTNQESADWSDLRYFNRLNTLVLDNQGLQDISCLEGLPVVRLSLRKNNISHLKDIELNPKMSALILADNPISDLSFLEDMTSIRELNVSDTYVDTIEVLYGTDIRTLNCAFTGITDYTVLRDLENLTELQISGADSEDIEFYNTLTQLEVLGLFDSDLESMDEIANLTNLQCLDAGDCQSLDSLDGIERYSKLSYLGIASTSVRDISQIKSLPYLNMLDITNAPVDLLPLKDCALTQLYIDADKEDAIREMKLGNRMEIIVAPSNVR